MLLVTFLLTFYTIVIPIFFKLNLDIVILALISIDCHLAHLSELSQILLLKLFYNIWQLFKVPHISAVQKQCHKCKRVFLYKVIFRIFSWDYYCYNDIFISFWYRYCPYSRIRYVWKCHGTSCIWHFTFVFNFNWLCEAFIITISDILLLLYIISYIF